MQRNVTKAIIFVCMFMVLSLAMAPQGQAGKGDSRCNIALVNTADFDIRMDISSDTGAVRYTVPAGMGDTVAVAIKMYATDTAQGTGLSIYEFRNFIYYDHTELVFVGCASGEWDADSMDIEYDVYSGDTSRIDIFGYGDLVEFDDSGWTAVYYLKFIINCNEYDEIELGLSADNASDDNWVRVTGDSSLDEYDSIEDGFVFIMAYWIGLEVDKVQTLLGEDTVRVPVYVDSLNFMCWVFSHFISYDTANFDYVGFERDSLIEHWYDIGCDAQGDSIRLFFATLSYYIEPLDSPTALYTLVFTSKAEEDSLISDLEPLSNDSTWYMAKSCNYISPEIGIEFESGYIEIPEYNFEVALEFGDPVEPGEYATLHVNVRGNFPAGEPNGELDLLLRPDRRLLGDSCLNIHDSIDLLVSRLQDSLITINMLPATPGYIPESDTFVKLCDLMLELDDTATYGCPDMLVVDFKYFYDNGWRCYVEDTTGSVYCGYQDETTSNDKMEFVPDTLIPITRCATIEAENTLGIDRAYQDINISYDFYLDSVYVELDYDNHKIDFGSATRASGLTIEEVDYNTVRIRGSNLDWAPDENAWLATILWCAEVDYLSTSTVDVNDSEVYDTNLVAADVTEDDGNVVTNRDPYGAYIPCPPKIPKKDEIHLPEQFALYQNTPNPFNPLTIISFELPEARHVKLEVFNILGQRVTGLLDDYLAPGRYDIEWNAGKEQVSSGVYFYIIRAGDFVETRKMMLLK